MRGGRCTRKTKFCLRRRFAPALGTSEFEEIQTTSLSVPLFIASIQSKA
jgi:hypothetical protein